jgi:hypothetical protein
VTPLAILSSRSFLYQTVARDFPYLLTSAIRSMYSSIEATAACDLSPTAVERVAAPATGLGPSFESLVPISIPTFYPLSPARAVFICHAKVTIETIITATERDFIRDRTLCMVPYNDSLSCVSTPAIPQMSVDRTGSGNGTSSASASASTIRIWRSRVDYSNVNFAPCSFGSFQLWRCLNISRPFRHLASNISRRHIGTIGLSP